MEIEEQILSQIVHSEPFARSVLPHLKDEYFASSAAKTLFGVIEKFTSKYASIPTIAALQVEVDGLEIDADKHEAAVQLIATIKPKEPVDIEWLTDKTEEHCKERAMYNALREALEIQSDPERSNGEITNIMTEALSVTFDSKIGHDYFEDAAQRYDDLHHTAAKIPFDIEIFNQATQGGVENKTLNIIMAGCVHPDTEVDASYEWNGVTKTKTIKIKYVGQLLSEGIDVSVLGPVGMVPVLEFVDKGMHDEYDITWDGGTLRCNADHLVMTHYGWQRTEELVKLAEVSDDQRVHIGTRNGFKAAYVEKREGRMCPIVDIVIGDETHAYYANGVESHNTNVGKSLILCHDAAAKVLAGHNVLYITCEMSAEKISQRIDANLIDLPLDKYKDMPKAWFLKRVEEVKKKSGGRLVVKEYASNVAHVGHIRHLLQELKMKKGFVPTIIYVDYINIMASQRFKPGKVPKDQYLTAIAEELRGLGQTENLPVMTATQTNREGFASSDADMTDVAGAWGLPLTADWFIVVIQPDDLAELGQYLVKQEKSRYDDKGKLRKFFVGVDKQKMKLHDLDVQPQVAGQAYDKDLPVFDSGAIAERDPFSEFQE